MTTDPPVTILHHVARQTTASPSSTDYKVTADDFVVQAEQHFSVSGTSVIAAWLMAAILGVSDTLVSRLIVGRGGHHLFDRQR